MLENNSALMGILTFSILTVNVVGFFYDGFRQPCEVRHDNISTTAAYFRTFLYKYPSWYHDLNASVGLHLFACGLLLAGCLEFSCISPVFRRGVALRSGTHEVDENYKKLGWRLCTRGSIFCIHRAAELIWLLLELVGNVSDIRQDFMPAPDEPGFIPTLVFALIHVTYRTFVVLQTLILFKTVTVGPPNSGREITRSESVDLTVPGLAALAEMERTRQRLVNAEDLPPSYSFTNLAGDAPYTRRGISFEEPVLTPDGSDRSRYETVAHGVLNENPAETFHTSIDLT
ncbi:hypothetical protein BV898_09512 [Hypsibius exemplaris]|uniref:Uncharacterized protein n=1 Tax=Hypsibius exemplaris TaxID=2072580 RepID=A0A1W0WMI6_HYPEX|nr:hypothetical protein BV898_09512 [Hypsibius exemplaris]